MYSITVKIEGIESKRRSAGLLHMVIGFFMITSGANYYRFTNYQQFLPIIPILLIASFSLFYGFFRRRIDLTGRYNYTLRLVQAIAFIYLGILLTGVGRSIDFIGAFIFAFLCFLLLISERRIFQETTIFIDESGVTIPGLYKNYLITWPELSDVVVREDFVTFFHVKQKYLQYQVMQDLSTLEVAKMNAFCKEQIEKVVVPTETNN
jgi:hypothetical protein